MDHIFIEDTDTDTNYYTGYINENGKIIKFADSLYLENVNVLKFTTDSDKDEFLQYYKNINKNTLTSGSYYVSDYIYIYKNKYIYKIQKNRLNNFLNIYNKNDIINKLHTYIDNVNSFLNNAISNKSNIKNFIKQESNTINKLLKLIEFLYSKDQVYEKLLEIKNILSNDNITKKLKLSFENNCIVHIYNNESVLVDKIKNINTVYTSFKEFNIFKTKFYESYFKIKSKILHLKQLSKSHEHKKSMYNIIYALNYLFMKIIYTDDINIDTLKIKKNNTTEFKNLLLKNKEYLTYIQNTNNSNSIIYINNVYYNFIKLLNGVNNIKIQDIIEKLKIYIIKTHNFLDLHNLIMKLNDDINVYLSTYHYILSNINTYIYINNLLYILILNNDVKICINYTQNDNCIVDYNESSQLLKYNVLKNNQPIKKKIYTNIYSFNNINLPNLSLTSHDLFILNFNDSICKILELLKNYDIKLINLFKYKDSKIKNYINNISYFDKYSTNINNEETDKKILSLSTNINIQNMIYIENEISNKHNLYYIFELSDKTKNIKRNMIICNYTYTELNTEMQKIIYFFNNKIISDQIDISTIKKDYYLLDAYNLTIPIYTYLHSLSNIFDYYMFINIQDKDIELLNFTQHF